MNFTSQAQKIAAGKLEERYLKNRAGESYIAGEDFDFLWSKEEVFDFDCLWAEGKRLDELARYFGRPQEEILILALDRGTKGRIGPRKGGLIGEMPNVREKDESH